MKGSDIRQKTKDDLVKLLAELREKLAVLNFDLAGGKVKNIKEIRSIKKDIARILTVMGQNLSK